MDEIKGGWQHLIGRRIEAVVTVPSREVGSLARVHLVLDGNVNFEIYSSFGAIGGTNRLHPGDLPEVLGWSRASPKMQVFGERRVVPR